MMFEELFSRKKQSKTTERELPREIDAVQKIQGGSKRVRQSSMTVDTYIWINRIVVSCIVLIGVVIIGSVAYGLVSDFINYSSGAPVGSSSIQTPSGEPEE